MDLYSGRYDYFFRDYDPMVRRWTTVDPIRDGLNWYIYCENNPVNMVDPTGLDTIYAGIALTGTSPNRMILNTLNKVQDLFDSSAKDWFETKVDSVSVSGGIYIDTEGGIGLYGTIGAGGGTPDVSAGIEIGSSSLPPDDFLTGTTTEVGGGVSYGPYSAQGAEVFSVDGESIGTETTVGVGIGLPVDLHVDVEQAAHIGIDFNLGGDE